jgi:hypothetical protein
MGQVISSMVDIRTYCHAARLAAFSCPQKHWNALIFRGALYRQIGNVREKNRDAHLLHIPS